MNKKKFLFSLIFLLFISTLASSTTLTTFEDTWLTDSITSTTKVSDTFEKIVINDVEVDVVAESLDNLSTKDYNEIKKAIDVISGIEDPKE